MRIVEDDAELIETVAAARREAKAAFGKDEVYLEKLIRRAMWRCRSWAIPTAIWCTFYERTAPFSAAIKGGRTRAGRLFDGCAAHRACEAAPRSAAP